MAASPNRSWNDVLEKAVRPVSAAARDASTRTIRPLRIEPARGHAKLPTCSISSKPPYRGEVGGVECLGERAHHAAAALAEIGTQRPVAELRRAAPGGKRGARRAHGLALQAPAADSAEKPPSGCSTMRAPLSRGTDPAASITLSIAALPCRSMVCRMRVQTLAISFRISGVGSRREQRQCSDRVDRADRLEDRFRGCGSIQRDRFPGCSECIASAIAANTRNRQHQRRLAHRFER